ncbi:MAG: DUF1684 domain-containing protein [Ferruginibacter sp.]|nr:DUF1684 domain-containing protein [Ferruginibacter sp.]
MNLSKQMCCFFLFVLLASIGKAQTELNTSDLAAWQKQINGEYANKATSPLSAAAITKFNGFDFFKEDSSLFVNATLTLSKEKKEVALKTSSSFILKQVEYGQITFLLNGKPYLLTLYQSPTHLKEKGLEDYLFLPFTDESNGITSYGGGRYIDLKIPAVGNNIVVDFNKAYNPYCAYSTGFSCPKVPAQNNLPIKILGGVKYVSMH